MPLFFASRKPGEATLKINANLAPNRPATATDSDGSVSQVDFYNGTGANAVLIGSVPTGQAGNGGTLRWKTSHLCRFCRGKPSSICETNDADPFKSQLLRDSSKENEFGHPFAGDLDSPFRHFASGALRRSVSTRSAEATAARYERADRARFSE